MRFRTSISKITDDDIVIRGQLLSGMMDEMSFADAIFLLLSGRMPKGAESRIFSAILVAIIDHGMGTTSSMAARFVMSGGNSLNTAVGGGILALGDSHGGAIEKAMVQLQSIDDPGRFVSDSIDMKKTIYGFGHKNYKESDPRVRRMIDICKENGYSSKYIDMVLELERLIERKKGKRVILNIDGMIAAILLEMGFPASVGKGVFIIGRTPGLVAQAAEEKEREAPVRRIDEEDIEYLP